MKTSLLFSFRICVIDLDQQEMLLFWKLSPMLKVRLRISFRALAYQNNGLVNFRDGNISLFMM